MKIERSTFWLCVGAALLLLLVVWVSKRADTTQHVKEDSPTKTVEQPSAIRPDRRETVLATLPRSNDAVATTIPNAAASKPTSTKEELTREALSSLNDVPIDFYGKLQDQFGNAVAGAEITGSVIFDNGSSNGVRNVQTTSDANGLFALHGGNGESLSVMPRKEGYALASTKAGFKYSHFYPEERYLPDASQPAVIEMRKLQGAERLIRFRTKAYVSLDGTPNAFDLQTGRRVESGGDIVLSIDSPASPDSILQYDWTAKIQAVGGGLINWNDAGFENMFLAPEDGYERELVIGHQRGAKPWSSRFTGNFYFRSRNGAAYGKLSIGIVTDVVKGESVPVTISSYVNPAGSRNLELDAARVIEAKP